jgi:hypothetical protein
MADVHLPQLDEDDEEESDEEEPAAAPSAATTSAIAGTRGRRGKSLLRIALEVALIGTGVFLGLAGEQWRESAQHREQAQASLRRFRSEILTNRGAVVAVKDYHVTTKKALDTYLAADAKTRRRDDVQVRGLQPVFFEHTAWDLALATQSLAYIEPQLGFALARTYNVQQEYGELTRGIMQAMYLRTPSDNLDGFFAAVSIYYGDVVELEPALLKMYDEIVPQIDRALGESSAGRMSSK